MQLFYVSNIPYEGDTFELPKEESHHAIQVLRLTKGDVLYLTNGQGALFQAQIIDNHPKKCLVKIVQAQMDFQKRDYYIHIALSPPKSLDRLEWFLEKAVEIGVDEVSFLLCDRSERKQVKLERLQKLSISAMKQSLKTYLPQLNPLQKFAQFISQPSPQNQQYIAYLDEEHRNHLFQEIVPKSSYCILIGPEGDFSPSEIQKALQMGFQAVSLGNSRLRTETAGVVACHLLNLINESNSQS